MHDAARNRDAQPHRTAANLNDIADGEDATAVLHAYLSMI
jgi:hypothetical protein